MPEEAAGRTACPSATCQPCSGQESGPQTMAGRPLEDWTPGHANTNLTDTIPTAAPVGERCRIAPFTRARGGPGVSREWPAPSRAAREARSWVASV